MKARASVCAPRHAPGHPRRHRPVTPPGPSPVRRAAGTIRPPPDRTQGAHHKRVHDRPNRRPPGAWHPGEQRTPVPRSWKGTRGTREKRPGGLTPALSVSHKAVTTRVRVCTGIFVTGASRPAVGPREKLGPTYEKRAPPQSGHGGRRETRGSRASNTGHTLSEGQSDE